VNVRDIIAAVEANNLTADAELVIETFDDEAAGSIRSVVTNLHVNTDLRSGEQQLVLS
jgi:hypothetical protein